MRRLVLLALVACGCDTGFRPESLVENLRVLGVRASPPEVRPGQIAVLDALVLDPSRPGQRSTVLWIGCDPDPFNQNRGACSDTAVLADPSALTNGTGTLPPGVHIIGFNANAAYGVPPTLFDVLPAGDERRLSGTVGQVLALAVAEEVSPTATQDELRALFERAQRKEVKSLITLFRVKVSEAPAPNANPVLGRLMVGGEAWPEGAHVQVLPNEQVKLDVEAPASSFETYVNQTPSGPEDKTERLLAAWYSTAGRYTEFRTALDEPVKTVFTAPGAHDDPVPDARLGTLFVVVRDTRGGQTWKTAPLYVCDPQSPAPAVSTVSIAAGLLVVEGTQLDGVLDVVVEGHAVSGGFVAARNRWEGDASRLPSGSHWVGVYTKRCTRFSAGPLDVP